MDKKEKRVVQIEIDDKVRKLTIEGSDKDQNVVMREELSEDELDQVAGGLVDGLEFVSQITNNQVTLNIISESCTQKLKLI
ncbi:MAG: hypothetical protein J6U14_05710 [Bacteroidaceae bacterium]|nr:hypothetical protein [Bacteroidaceae bacterium]